MNSSVKRILISSLAAGILILVSCIFLRARASSLPPHLVLFGSAQRLIDNQLLGMNVWFDGASISISNAGPEEVFLHVLSEPRRVRGPHNYGFSPGLFKQGEVIKLGDFRIHDNQLPFHIEATARGPFANRAYQSSLLAFRALWITWDLVHARNVYNAAMKQKFLGRTFDFVKPIVVEPPQEVGEEKLIAVHLMDTPDETRLGAAGPDQ